MKNLLKYLVLPTVLFTFLVSCQQDDPDPFPSKLIKGCYIINYGNWGAGGASISKFDYESNEIVNNYYNAQNNGIELLSNLQYAGIFNDSIYMIGNLPDELLTVNPLFQQSQNGFNDQLTEPRFFVADANYLYISCYGESPDYFQKPNSYIAKYNIETQSIEKTISLPGGPEGLAIAKGNLYAALNYMDSVAVINLSDESISYIATPAVPSYFQKDATNNLYVSLVSTFSNPSFETGIGFINTSTNTLDEFYYLDGISYGWSQVLTANNDYSKLLVVASAWVEEADGSWVQKGAVYSFDVLSGTFSMFAENLIGANGVAVNPDNNNIYILLAPSATEAGSILIYNELGNLQNELTCGIYPSWTLFID